MSSSFTKSWSTNAGPFLLFAFTYYIDHALTNIAIYPVYLAPILWVTSKWGLRAGIPLAILSGGSSTPMHTLLEWSKNTAYLDIFITRSVTLTLLAIFFSNYRNQVISNRRSIERLKELVPQCPDCGAVFCHDGQWRSMEELISNPENFGTMPRHNCNADKQPTEP